MTQHTPLQQPRHASNPACRDPDAPRPTGSPITYGERFAVLPVCAGGSGCRWSFHCADDEVAALRDYLEGLWSAAAPVEADPPASSISPLERRILHQLCLGAKDESAARMLGISVRTYRRHVTALCVRLGASSRFRGRRQCRPCRTGPAGALKVMSMPGQAAGTEPSPGARRAHRPVGWHTRLLRLLTGQARVPRDARLVILAAMAQTIATSGFSTYVGIWAIEGLHASAAALGVALLLRAGSGVLTGPVGGRWSDTHGRRPVIVGSWLAQAACIGAFAVVGHSVAIGLTLVVLFGPLGPPGRAAAAAYIADVTSPGERPVAYSALRSAQALAQITGPAIAAVLAGGSRWPIMFGTLAVISFAAACGAALLPRRRGIACGQAGPPRPPQGPARRGGTFPTSHS